MHDKPRILSLFVDLVNKFKIKHMSTHVQSLISLFTQQSESNSRTWPLSCWTFLCNPCHNGN